MSKHMGRKERWTRVNAKEYRALFGVVRYERGAWEGTVVYEARSEAVDAPAWQTARCPAGRYKRPRNAMMAVEGKAQELQRQLKDTVQIQV